MTVDGCVDRAHLFCDGLGTTVARLKRFCASSKIPVLLNSICDVEEYRVEMSGVNVLESVIVPDISSQ